MNAGQRAIWGNYFDAIPSDDIAFQVLSENGVSPAAPPRPKGSSALTEDLGSYDENGPGTLNNAGA